MGLANNLNSERKKGVMLSVFDVSVIVVNYNCSATLENCINSLLSSRGFGELLLVDNGSTDRSLV